MIQRDIEYGEYDPGKSSGRSPFNRPTEEVVINIPVPKKESALTVWHWYTIVICMIMITMAKDRTPEKASI